MLRRALIGASIFLTRRQNAVKYGCIKRLIPMIPMAKQSYTYLARNAGRDPHTREQRWIGYIKEVQGLTVEENTQQRAIEEIRKLHKTTQEDDRKWLGEY
jgi:hypothetical protein